MGLSLSVRKRPLAALQMTSLEQRAVMLLPNISYSAKTWHQDRAKTLYRFLHRDPLWTLTALEQADLWLIIWTYRRQVADAELVAHADHLVNQALALRF